MLLADLPTDALRELFCHVEHPFMPKLACRAFRDAAPKKTRTPTRAVVASIAILRWARATMGAARFKDMRNILDCIAATGQLDVFIWARAHAAGWNERVFPLACGSGCRPLVEWIVQRHSGDLCFPQGRNACAAAAANNHLDLLKWLCETQAPYGTNAKRRFSIDGASAVAAAANGHLRVLKWVCETLPLAASDEELNELNKLRRVARENDRAQCVAWIDTQLNPVFERLAVAAQ